MLQEKPKGLLLESGEFSGLNETIRDKYSGFEFMVCQEGYKAIELINHNISIGSNFELIILDFPASEFSRFELFTFLKNNKYAAKYMMITGMNGRVHLEPFSLNSDYNELVKRYQVSLSINHFNDVLLGIPEKKS